MRVCLRVLLISLLFTSVAMSQADHKFTQADLPDSLTNKAEIVFLATYRRYRGPCTPVRMKGGKMGRRWRMYYGFGIQKRLKGKVVPDIVTINTYQLPKNHPINSNSYTRYQDYWVFINPSERTQKAFAEKYTQLSHTVSLGEIVAILPAKKE